MKILSLLIFLFLSNLCFAQIPTTNLIAWYSADNVVIVSDYVSQWNDNSVNNFHLVQNNSTSRPVKVENQYNGHSVIKFDGINDYLTVNFGQTYTQPISFFIVWKINESKAQYIFDGINNTSISLNYPYNTPPTLRTYAGASGGISISYNKPISSNFTISTLLVDNPAKVYDNGVLKGTLNIGNNSLTGLNIGSDYSGNIRYMNGEVAEIIIYNSFLSDSDKITVEEYLQNKYFPPVDLSQDINVPYGFCDTIIKTAYKPWFNSYLWNTGDTDSVLHVNKAGTYSVTVTDIFGKQSSDELIVSYPHVNELTDTIICYGNQIVWNTNLSKTNYNFEWIGHTETDSLFLITEEGEYAVIITDTLGCKYYTDTILMSFDNYELTANIGEATQSLCTGNKLFLVANAEETISYNWNTGNTESTISVMESGLYSVSVTNRRGCNAVCSANVTIIGTSPLIDFEIQNLCLGEITEIIDHTTSIDDIISWEWVINNEDVLNSQNLSWEFVNSGIQTIQFSVATGAPCVSDTIFNIEILKVPLVDFTILPICTNLEATFLSNIQIPNGLSVISYSWIIDNQVITNTENMSYIFQNDGDYEVRLEVVVDNLCISSKSKTVSVKSTYPIPENLSLIFPSNGIISQDDIIEFKWNISDNAICYKIILSSDIDFTDIIYSQNYITELSHIVDLTSYRGTIYWKVIAYNPCLEIISSEIFSIIKFNPVLSSLKLWCSADNAVLDNGFVSQWTDLSGNNLNFSQTNVSYRPKQVKNITNDYFLLNFDGTNDFMKATFAQNISQPMTIFIVWKANVSKAQHIFDGINNTGITFNYPYNTPPTLRTYAGASGGISISYDKPISNNLTINALLLSNPSKVYDNGLLKGSMNIGNNLLSGLNLGTDYTGSQRYFNGDIAEVILYEELLSDSERIMVEKYLQDKYFPPVNLGEDIHISEGFCDTIIKLAYKPWFREYNWSTGETDSVIHVNKSGMYIVTVTDIFGRQSIDELMVFYPHVEEIRDTVVCYGQQIIWDTKLDDEYFSFEWIEHTETGSSIIINNEGEYAAIITDVNGCKYYTDTIVFSFDNYENEASIGPSDTVLCAGNKLFLISNKEETDSYSWSTGSTNPEILVYESGTYSVTVTNRRGCEAVDNIIVTIGGSVPFPAFDNFGHCENNIVRFIDESSSNDAPINNWLWKVNNVEVSFDQNLEYVFDAPGNYNISLSVKTSNNCSDFIEKVISIYPLPIINFTPDYFCQNSEITFISNSEVDGGSILYNSWYFDSNFYVGNSVNYIFSDEGLHQVKLISSTNMSCTDSIVTDIFVRNAGLPNYEVRNTCVDKSAYFINNTEANTVNPVLEWLWYFGDGETSILSNSEHIYTSAGVYNTELKMKYSNGCVVIKQVPIEIYHNPEVSILDLNICASTLYNPNIFELSQSGEINYYHWKVEAVNTYESYQRYPNFLLDEAGLFPISLEVGTDLSCFSKYENNIEVYDLPKSKFDLSRNYGAIPFLVEFYNESVGAERYHWDFGDEKESNLKNPVNIFYEEGEYNTRLISISNHNCSDTSYSLIKAVVPKLDLILYNIQTEVVNGYLKTSVYILNNSNLSVQNAEITLNLGNGRRYREIINNIDLGSVINYRFFTDVYVYDENSIDFICIEISAPIFEIIPDNNISNNDICNSYVNSFKVFSPYPNPTNQKLNCGITSQIKTDVVFIITNSVGSIVFKDTLNAFEGYIDFEIDVINFTNGLYYLKVISDDSTNIFKVEIIN